MSFYTSSIKSKEIEPTYHTNNRTEFRLGSQDRPMYLSSMRLCNIGVTTNSNTELNRGAGVYSIIKSIQIMDDNVSLENFHNFNQYVGFKQQNKTNDSNLSQAGKLVGNQMGFANDDYVVSPLNAGGNIGTSENGTTTGWLSLRDYMSFLSSSNEIPTSVFKDLRIVIEYETDIGKIAPSGPANNIASIVRPFLVVDEVVNQDLKSQREKMYQGISYTPIESSQVYWNAITADSSKSFTLTGFNNKTINKLLLVKAPTYAISQAYGSLSSVNFTKQRSNLLVNGSQLLPQDIDTTAKELSSVSELYGDCNIPYPYSSVGSATPETIVNSSANRVGWQSYVAFDVSQFSRELVLNMTRGYNANGYYSQAINLFVFADVLKAIQMNSDGSYNVVYV